MSLTSFITNEFRPFYDSDEFTEELGDKLIGACAKQAARRISKFSPRKNVRTNLIISDGDTSVIFPADFMSATVPALYQVKTGQTLSDLSYADITLSIWGELTYYISDGGSKFRADGAVYARRSFNDSFAQEAITIYPTTNQRFALYLDTESAIGRTVSNFTYDALHQITDTVGEVPAVDTIGADLRDTFMDIVMHLSLLTHGRQLVRQAKDSAEIAAAQLFIDEAKHYGQSLGTIAPFGDGA